MRVIIEHTSHAAVYVMTNGTLQASLCALAWLMRWRIVWLLDRICWHEARHTEASFWRCFG